MRRPASLALVPLAVLALLAGCGSARKGGTPDNEPTLASLAGRQVTLAPDTGIRATEEQAIAAWQGFLKLEPPPALRAQALRRLGDLEMDLTDSRIARGEGGTTASGAPDYRAAIARYRQVLQDHPQDPDRDRVLYQLARAQEQGGELDAALKTLDTLVTAHPGTVYRDEAEFRRGELLFGARDYAKAEQAYTTVLAGGADPALADRALYMQGWSRFKQGRLEDALQSFFGVFDATLAGLPSETGEARAANAGASESNGATAAAAEDPDDDFAGLSRADRELVEDSLRVASISLANLQGAASIPPFVTDAKRRGYEFHVYRALGELYLKQDRIKDAADTFGAFARRSPLHAQAPRLQARVIEIYQATGFATLALEAKQDYVTRYGIDGEFRRANPQGWARAQPLVKTHLTELARHHHAVAQKSRASADVQQAVRWYRLYIASFPGEPGTAANHFLLAELLAEDQRQAEAATEFEKTAYDYPAHERSADAGYAALLAHAGVAKAASADARPAAQRAGVDSALRFADRFPADARVPAVLTNTAETLFALREAERAGTVARRVLALAAPVAATPAQQRVAWTVLAHGAFERGAFDEAERDYAQVLALVPAGDPARADLVERQAAAIYKQGERARGDGRARDAVAHFERIAAVAPQSSVRAAAQYDAAAALIGLKDWAAAAGLLEDFRSRFPTHPLQSELGAKLALVYLEQQQWARAAGEFERLAEAKAAAREPALARDALWQAADLREKAVAQGAPRREAIAGWERYLKAHPQPLEPAVEARQRLALLARADGQPARELALMNEILQADRNGGAERTPRTRTLAAGAALAVAEPVVARYREVALVEPLQKQLKLKKARFEEALKAYAQAADYGIAEVTTAATFHTAALYQDFGRSLLGSQRPKKLSKTELAQYDVLLEEQAFPFEEKAIELHELNARRAGEGVYDAWVQRSFAALGQLRPVRYGKAERLEETIDAIR